ncbi:hypothetical protein C0J52_05241 [Blattella germanica]|nr:hypothetical protein C0J52_05241 [Blattella germanica]
MSPPIVVVCIALKYKSISLLADYHQSGQSVFAPGWKFLGGKKDASDYEWAIWAPYLCSSIPWLCVHLVGAEVVRYFCRELLSLWYLTVSLMYLLLNIGAVSMLYILIEPFVMYGLLQLERRSVLYIAGLVLLVFHNTDIRMNWMPITYESQYLLMLATAWIYMRCQSFCQDKLSSGKIHASVTDIVTMLGYCLYFPMLFLGPLMLFVNFEEGVNKPYSPWTIQRLKILVLNLIRYCWWGFFLEALTHVLYISAIQMDMKLLTGLGAWAHYGLGFGMGIVFQLKYVVSYGISCTIAKAEKIQSPHPPKCVGRIHLYSDMWRHFDQGLYLFLRKYIYVPILGNNYSLCWKLMASLMCFMFVYAWHRVYNFVLMWSVLNYVGVTLEALGKALGATSGYLHYEKMLLVTPENIRRFHALLGTPMLIMSALSNFYFFAGMSVGNYYVKRFMTGCLQENFGLFLFCYCLSQVSIEVKNWEFRQHHHTKQS